MRSRRRRDRGSRRSAEASRGRARGPPRFLSGSRMSRLTSDGFMGLPLRVGNKSQPRGRLLTNRARRPRWGGRPMSARSCGRAAPRMTCTSPSLNASREWAETLHHVALDKLKLEGEDSTSFMACTLAGIPSWFHALPSRIASKCSAMSCRADRADFVPAECRHHVPVEHRLVAQECARTTVPRSPLPRQQANTSRGSCCFESI